MKKPSWLKDIKVLVWDLDGTLYKDKPEIKNAIHNNIVRLIAKVKQLSLKESDKLFEKKYKRIGSVTQALINCGVNKDYVFSGKWYSKVQLKYLKADKRLPEIFKKLKLLRHFINTNGTAKVTKKKLKRLGLNLKFFEKIISNADMVKKLKPDPASFRMVLKYSNLPANKHLFIGDREETDLIPAKKIGMKTCMVWKKSSIADISLLKVYDVVKLFQ